MKGLRLGLLSVESAEVGEQGLNTSEGQENTTKRHPTVGAITFQKSTGEIW